MPVRVNLCLKNIREMMHYYKKRLIKSQVNIIIELMIIEFEGGW